MPSKLIALHGETKLISPRRLDTSSASPQWIMITAGTASLTTRERWHQIGLQWDETWDVQRGKRKNKQSSMQTKTTLMEILDLGFANCHDSSLLTRPARLLQTLQFMHAYFETYFSTPVFIFSESVWTFLFVPDAASTRSTPFISLYIPLHPTVPPTILLFLWFSVKDEMLD